MALSLMSNMLTLGLTMQTQYVGIQDPGERVLRGQVIEEKGGPIGTLSTDSKLGSANYFLKLWGFCSGFQSDLNSTKPKGVDQDYKGSVFCAAREMYGEIASTYYSLNVGKKILELSQAQLTSPSNPSRAGLLQGGPFDDKEGIIGARGTLFLGANLTLIAGAAVQEGINASEVEQRDIKPYGVIRTNIGNVDLHVSGAQRFAGIGATIQASDTVILYSESNAFKPVKQRENPDDVYEDFSPVTLKTYEEKLKNDNLVGITISPLGFSYNITFEYFHNSLGVGGEASDGRFRKAGVQSQTYKREDMINFPAPQLQSVPPWGVSEYMSRDYLFFNFYRPTENEGLRLRNLFSLNDHSGNVEIGYNYLNTIAKWAHTWVLGASWQGNYGKAYSEFNEVAKMYGKNRFVLLFEYKV